MTDSRGCPTASKKLKLETIIMSGGCPASWGCNQCPLKVFNACQDMPSCIKTTNNTHTVVYSIASEIYKNKYGEAQFHIIDNVYDPEVINTLCKISPLGKLLPDALYIHYSVMKKIHPKLSNLITRARIKSNVYSYNVIKISRISPIISFLRYDDFDYKDHPALERSTIINYEKDTIKVIDFSQRKNRPILHRKELFVDKDYVHYDSFVTLTQKELTAGYYNDTKFIGTEKGWKKIIKEKCI